MKYFKNQGGSLLNCLQKDAWGWWEQIMLVKRIEILTSV